MKKRIIVAVLILIISILSGCGEKKETEKLEEGFYAMAEEFQNIYFTCDQMADTYDDSLKKMKEYMEDRSEESRKETLSHIQQAEESIQNQEIKAYSISEKVKKFLKERGIPEAEFLAIAEMRTSSQAEYLKQIEIYKKSLSEYIATVGIIPMSLKVTVDYQDKMHQCEQMWMSYATNEVFLSLTEAELDYMKKNVFSKGDFYCPEEMEWQTEAAHALQKQEEYWNKEVSLMSDMMEEVGKLVNQEYGEEYGYVIDLDGNACIIRYIGESTETEIPEMIQDYPVTEICSGAFGDTNIKEVSVPAMVEKFGEDIFVGCPDVILYGEKGSKAETYAKEASIPFRIKEK